MKLNCDTFSFQGKPDSMDIQPVKDGYRILFQCKDIEFKICNLTGTFTEEEIYFYTAKEDVVNNLDRIISIQGVIGTPDKENKRKLIALKVR